jgi:hypothetical protein
MTTPIPPTEHEEIDFFDEIEKELVALTTATLEDEKSSRTTVIVPAPAGNRQAHHGPSDGASAATQTGHGSPPAQGVISAQGRQRKYHRNNE